MLPMVSLSPLPWIYSFKKSLQCGKPWCEVSLSSCHQRNLAACPLLYCSSEGISQTPFQTMHSEPSTNASLGPDSCQTQDSLDRTVCFSLTGLCQSVQMTWQHGQLLVLVTVKCLTGEVEMTWRFWSNSPSWTLREWEAPVFIISLDSSALRKEIPWKQKEAYAVIFTAVIAVIVQQTRRLPEVIK